MWTKVQLLSTLLLYTSTLYFFLSQCHTCIHSSTHTLVCHALVHPFIHLFLSTNSSMLSHESQLKVHFSDTTQEELTSIFNSYNEKWSENMDTFLTEFGEEKNP